MSTYKLQVVLSSQYEAWMKNALTTVFLNQDCELAVNTKLVLYKEQIVLRSTIVLAGGILLLIFVSSLEAGSLLVSQTHLPVENPCIDGHHCRARYVLTLS